MLFQVFASAGVAAPGEVGVAATAAVAHAARSAAAQLAPTSAATAAHQQPLRVRAIFQHGGAAAVLGDAVRRPNHFGG